MSLPCQVPGSGNNFGIQSCIAKRVTQRSGGVGEIVCQKEIQRMNVFEVWGPRVKVLG